MAQERCIRRTAQFGRLWLAGEVRTIDKEDERGHPVVSDHFRLVESGEAVEDRDAYDDEAVAEKRKESGLRDKTAGITAALEKLDCDDDTHWTRKGDPSLQQVFKHTDFEVSRGAVREVWPEFNREYARGLRRDKAREDAA